MGTLSYAMVVLLPSHSAALAASLPSCTCFFVSIVGSGVAYACAPAMLWPLLCHAATAMAALLFAVRLPAGYDFFQLDVGPPVLRQLPPLMRFLLTHERIILYIVPVHAFHIFAILDLFGGAPLTKTVATSMFVRRYGFWSAR